MSEAIGSTRGSQGHIWAIGDEIALKEISAKVRQKCVSVGVWHDLGVP